MRPCAAERVATRTVANRNHSTPTQMALPGKRAHAAAITCKSALPHLFYICMCDDTHRESCIHTVIYNIYIYIYIYTHTKLYRQRNAHTCTQNPRTTGPTGTLPLTHNLQADFENYIYMN